MLEKLIRTERDPSLLALRVMVGFVFFVHGAQKALGWFGGGGFQETMHQFGQMGLPAPVAFLVIMGEFLGSLGLMAGLLGRVAATGIVLIMLGAIALVHWPHGFFMNWYGQQQGEGFEFHLLAIAAALPIVMKGSGLLSVDRALMEQAMRRSWGTIPQPRAR